MSPEERAAINKQNSTHSTGPVSASGRATVSGNAVKHALSAKSHAVLRGEEEAFGKHLHGYVTSYAPQTTPEQNLVRTLAENFWRLERAHRMESAAFDLAFAEALEQSSDAIPALAHADAFADSQKRIQLYATYAARIQRAIDKTTFELKSLQTERKAAYAKAEAEAILLTKLANTHQKVSQAAAYFSEGAGRIEAPAASAATQGSVSAEAAAGPNETSDQVAANPGAVNHGAVNQVAANPGAVNHGAVNQVAANPGAVNHGGFVYSFEEIKKKIVRQGRLDEARARFSPEPSDISALLKGALL